MTGQVLLPEPLLLDPVRVALDGEAVAVEVRDQRRRDLHVVAEQVALRDRVPAVPGGEEHLVEVRDPDLPPADGPGALLLERVEGGDLVIGLGHDPGSMGTLGLLGRPGGGDGPLAAHVPRVLVRLEALVRRLAQQPVRGPLGELDADDQPRLDPARTLQARRGIERRVGSLDLLELRAQLAPGAGVEPAADLAGVHPAVAAANGEDERAEVHGAPLPRQPADDDDLLLEAHLELEPRLAAPIRLVRRAPQLGDDALELLLPRRLEERDPVGLDVAGVADHRVRAQAAAEQALALLERHVEQRPAVEVEQVEGLVHERRRRAAALAARRCGRCGCRCGPGAG